MTSKSKEITILLIQLRLTGVNFINILRERFLYEHCFGSIFQLHVHRKTTFVRKIRTFNVDEIDGSMGPSNSYVKQINHGFEIFFFCSKHAFF